MQLTYVGFPDSDLTTACLSLAISSLKNQRKENKKCSAKCIYTKRFISTNYNRVVIVSKCIVYCQLEEQRMSHFSRWKGK